MILFGTPVMVYDGLIAESLRTALVAKSKEICETTENGSISWRCDVFTTCHTRDLLLERSYNDLNQTTCDKVEHFLKIHDVKDNLVPNFSWLNAYTSKQYQDWHKHPCNLVSTVYFLDAPEGSAPLVLQQPYMPDNVYENIGDNYFNQEHAIKAVSNRLVVFPSWLPHSVPQGSNEELRYTIATNFERRQPNGISPTQNPTEA